jgi:Mg-chelatase subunit ChlD
VSGSDEVLALLRALCAGLSPHGIEVLPDDTRTAFMPRRNRILVSRRFLAADTPVAIGALLHEVGHALVTRYDRFDLPEKGNEALWRDGLNAVEENRVHSFLRRRLPGVGRYLEALFAMDEVPVEDHFESDLLAFLGATAVWDRYQSLPFLAHRPVAAAVFARTGAARRRYSATLPPSDFAPRPDLARRYVRDVAPSLIGDDDASIAPGEAEILCAAAAALTVFQNEIWPEIEKLAACDQTRIAASLRNNPHLREEAEPAVEARQGAPLAARALRMTPAATGEAGRFKKLAGSLFEQYLRDDHSWPRTGYASARLSLGSMKFAASSAAEGAAAPVPEAAVPATTVADPEELAAVLRAALPRRPRRWIAGYQSGIRLDLERAMRAMATGEQTDRIWARRVVDRPALATLLLVDLSGSMRHGGKIEAAVTATRALSAALASVNGISWAVLGFQDQIIPFVGFEERANSAILARIETMREEVAGTRSEGNNQPGYNDDGPCLREAAAQLARRPERDRLLMVISDGAPEGRHSGSQELHEAVSAVLAIPDLTLVGLGIGPTTDHVTRFYPRSQANIAPNDLALVIGALLASRSHSPATTIV